MKTSTKRLPTVLIAMLCLTTAAALLPTSCDVKDPIYDAPVAVSLTASIEDGAPASEGATQWQAGDAIGICMIDAETGTTANGVFNFRYTAATAGTDVQMLPDGDANTAYFPGDGALVNLLAYHPYAASAPTEGTSQAEGSRQAEGVPRTEGSRQAEASAPTADLRLPVDVSTQPATDLLTARADRYHRLRPLAALRFGHRLVKLIFALQPNDGVDATQLPGARLLIRGMNTKALCLLADGSVTDASAPRDIEVPLNAAGTSGMAIVLPRDAAAGVSFVVTLADGREYTTLLGDAQALTAGTRYAVSLGLDADPVEASISIGPWQEGGEGGGDAGMEIP